VAVAAVIGGTWGYVAWKESRAEGETRAFARVNDIASAQVIEPDKAKPGAEKPAEGVTTFKSETERVEATLREADAFLSAHGTAGLGRRVLLMKASRLLALGKTDEARATYQQFLAGEAEAGMRLIAQEGLAIAMESSGKVPEALTLYEQMADEALKAGFYADRVLFAKARLLHKQGKTAEAEKTLREILDRVPNTLLRREIDDRLALLGSK
jgi:tetratricopeptide (TPR) repeat protein